MYMYPVASEHQNYRVYSLLNVRWKLLCLSFQNHGPAL